MIFFSPFKEKNTILNRCKNDKITKLRIRYKPYYHTFDKQSKTKVILNNKEMILLSSNDYLGLGNHPKVIEAGKKALDIWGSSTTGARLANGSRLYHTQLEEQLASFLGKEACFVSSAGYISCMSSIQPFAQKGDLIIADKNVHSSLWSGIALTHAQKERFSHNDINDLERIINFESKKVPKIIVFEGVYSMEGHISDVPNIVKVTKNKNCFLIMDDAHGFGVLGKEGRGTSNHFNLTNEIDIICGSFSKSLSSIGGYIASKKSIIEYLKTHSKQTIFSASLSPTQAYCSMEALKIIQKEPEHLIKLWENEKKYKKMLLDLKLDIWESKTPAVPIVLGSKERVYRFWKSLMKKGIFTVMSIAPAVPPGKDLIRTSISSRHTEQDLEKIYEAMCYAIKKL
jgi:8-amino-7-oxononanoate synthase